jgi:toluene monooxygenase system ferredoxin subunit
MTDQWHEAMNLDDLWEGEMDAVDIAGTSVLLVNVDGDVRAYRNRCPHQASPLHEGDLDGDTITCARHLWEFDARSGQGVNPDNCRLVAYPCRVTDDGTIQVSLK